MFIKYALAALVICCCFAGYSQTTQRSTVSGHLNFTEKQNRVLEITYRRISGGYQFDSTGIINGQFKFEKEISEPIVVIMSIKSLPGTPRGNQGSVDYMSLLLTPGNGIKINGTSDLKSATISGTGAAVNNDYQDYLN